MIDGHFRESVGSIGLAEDEELRHRLTSRTSSQILEEIRPLSKKELKKNHLSWHFQFLFFAKLNTEIVIYIRVG
jgi:hypothetical protein